MGSVIDPGPDTVTGCTIDWGDGANDDCLAALGGGLLSHTYGTSFVNPSITVNLTDEDGTHVAATKTVTVTGVPTVINPDIFDINVNEGQVVTNTGSYSPVDAVHTWSASEGTVVDEGNGIWSWSLDAGSPDGDRQVTIYADSYSAAFTLNVQGDGAPANVEDGAPNGGDGNDDGIADRAQMNVASLPSPLTGQYVTLAVEAGLAFNNVSFPATPGSGADTLPANADFPLGFPTFNLTGIGAGDDVQVSLYLTSTNGINSYYKYDGAGGWFNFTYDDASHTGAEVLSDRINLYFVDGARGDGDGSANGAIADPGGPAYELPTYELTINVSGNGSISESSGTHVAGTELNLQVTEVPGWTFSGWSGALSGVELSQVLVMDEDKTVTAVFTPIEYTLGVQVIGNGTVDRDPLKGSYGYGDTVALEADADTGWTFAGWSGDLGGNNPNESVTLDSNKAVIATFTQNVYSVNASSGGGGSVVLSPQLSGYAYGDTVAVQAVPDPGYAFQGWNGDLSGDASGQILVVDGNKTATAIFGATTYNISRSTVGNGVIILNPDKATYAYGEQVQVTATPDATWSFTEWKLDLGGNSASQLLTVSGNTSLQAIFEPATYKLNVAWIGDGTAQKQTDRTEFTFGEDGYCRGHAR